MPPRLAPTSSVPYPSAASSSRPQKPPQEEINDPHDILTVIEIQDALDAMPLDLTKSFSDLRELDAVLNSTINHLTTRLSSFASTITDAALTPTERFQTLLEISEEISRFKLGGEDKIRVAGLACETLITHQTHINHLLSASTLLRPDPNAVPVHHYHPYLPSKRPRGSPMPGRVGETPKKKRVIKVAGTEDDGDGAGSPVRRVFGKKVVGGAKKKARGGSPTDSVVSQNGPATTTTVGGVAVSSSGRVQRPNAGRHRYDDLAEENLFEEAGDDEEGGSGGEGASLVGSVAENAGGSGKPARAGARRGAAVGTAAAKSKKDSEPLVPATVAVNTGKSNGKSKGGKTAEAAAAAQQDVQMEYVDPGEDQETLYCYCQKPSSGEMIGCDSDDCQYEWFHLTCLGLVDTPPGDWVCPDCTDRIAAAAKQSGGKKGARKTKSKR